MTAMFAVSFDQKTDDGYTFFLGHFTFHSADAKSLKQADVRASYKKAAAKAKAMAARKFKFVPSRQLVLSNLHCVG